MHRVCFRNGLWMLFIAIIQEFGFSTNMIRKTDDDDKAWEFFLAKSKKSLVTTTFFLQRLPPDIILHIAANSIIFSFIMWRRKVIPTRWNIMTFFMKEDVVEVKLVLKLTRWTIRPVVDLLFHGNSLIFDIANFKVVVEPYVFFFVVQVIWY